MRLRHIKNGANIIASSDFVITNPEFYLGKWQKLFGNNNPLYLEIGMGKGNFLIQNALTYPNINFIGIERYDSVLVRTLKKLKTLNIPNLKIIRIDALEVDKIFKKEINRIYLNFSDPWPKAKHEKRRLTSIGFLEKYDKILKNKEIIIKTDNRHFFEYSILSLTTYGYKIKDISLNLYEDEITDNIPTEYEEKFHQKGLPIYMIKFFKSN